MKLAIIDIGSNSVRLMLWADGKSLYKKVITTRLAAGSAKSGILSEEAILRTVKVVSVFCEEAKRECASIYAFATAAVRSAQNGGAFCEKVLKTCGVAVEVISGKDEARLAVLGALGEKDGGIIDIGGASAEVCIRKNGETVFSVSMNIGAVTLFDACKDDREKLKKVIDEALSPLNGIKAEKGIYAVGGTASTLASVKLGLDGYDSKRVHNLPLERDWVKETANRLLDLSAEERARIAGMDVSRADVIAGAACLLAEIMKKLDCSEVLFSDCDNLEGYIVYRGLV